ncbi:hypothetical protein GAYE_SCF05G2562 [Galdieria yellowstonensis]|uniref:Ribosomal protein mS38 C-terminal domain-containing protein n=1 Tax=Galdieria yellowstonensis TaxID=3028027 RepID=A0AAV9IB78_9RHOD|nr:hypothetical protein GAYE_SCF05G2562 [Galdieria yellowstonensis]
MKTSWLALWRLSKRVNWNTFQNFKFRNITSTTENTLKSYETQSNYSVVSSTFGLINNTVVTCGASRYLPIYAQTDIRKMCKDLPSLWWTNDNTTKDRPVGNSSFPMVEVGSVLKKRKKKMNKHKLKRRRKRDRMKTK